MRLTLGLVAFCVLVFALAIELSPAAGRLPMVVAAVTLVPLGLQLWKDVGAPQQEAPAGVARLLSEPLGLLVATGVLGLFVALPGYALWTWRGNLRIAIPAAIGLLALLYALSRVMEIHSGVLAWL